MIRLSDFFGDGREIRKGYDNCGVLVCGGLMMVAMAEVVDTMVIGGGPAGLAAAMHLGFHGRNVVIVDRRSSPMNFYDNPVNNYPGVRPLQSGMAILRKMRGEVLEMGVKIMVGNVVDVEGVCPAFEVHVVSKGQEGGERVLTARTLVVATGTARKHPRVQGEWRRWLPFAAKKEISYYCPDCESPLTRGKDILIVNAGTVHGALHVAESIRQYAQRIRIFMTEDGVKPVTAADRAILDKSGYDWASGLIERIEVDNPGERQRLITAAGEVYECNHFFVAWVDEPRSELAVKLGVDIDKAGNILTDKRGKTCVEGVWAAGDVRPVTQSVAYAVGTGNYAGIMVNQFLRDLDKS